jgi:HSP20 family molecular chaperone IbpA
MDRDDEWEEKILEQLEQMFQQMGIPISKDQLRGFIRQFQDQFDKMGIDPEKIANGDVNFNFDLSDITKLFQSGESIDSILKNLGVGVQVDAAPIELDEAAIVDDEVVKLPSDDVYLEGWNMSVTIDFALKGDLEPEQIELELIQNGSEIEVLKSTQSKPIARIELPHPCDDVIDWTLNNGILDITLKLTPQGSALNDDEHDDDIPPASDIAVDLSDDDDDDDGGIPIF